MRATCDSTWDAVQSDERRAGNTPYNEKGLFEWWMGMLSSFNLFSNLMISHRNEQALSFQRIHWQRACMHLSCLSPPQSTAVS